MVPQRDRYECISRKCIRIYIKVKKETTYLQPQEDTRIYSRFYCDAKFRRKSTEIDDNERLLFITDEIGHSSLGTIEE